MKKKTNYLVRIQADPAKVTARATSIVQKIVQDKGYDHHDIARLCDTTVVSLLDGSTPKLSKIQLKAIAKHFEVNLLWLITGLGEEFAKQKTAPV